MDNAFAAGQRLLCGGYSAYTPTGKNYFVRAARWNTRPAYGAIIYFYSSSMGRVSHVGIVTSARMSGGVYHIQTIEGNTSGRAYDRDGGEVAAKEYSFRESDVGHGRINGFGYPVFGSDTCTADEFIAAAKAEIGYIEKTSASHLDDKTGNPGKANYTKYGAWYGVNPGAWCQMFVSWCAYLACKSHQVAQRTGWSQEGGDWQYFEDGEPVRDEWRYIDGRWYVFDAAGRMVTGWYKAQEGYYYLAGDGALCTSQWVEDNGKNYFMTRTGLMATSCYVRSDMPYAPGKYIYYWVGEDGAWIPKWDTDEPDLRRYYCAT